MSCQHPRLYSRVLNFWYPYEEHPTAAREQRPPPKASLSMGPWTQCGKDLPSFFLLAESPPRCRILSRTIIAMACRCSRWWAPRVLVVLQTTVRADVSGVQLKEEAGE